MCEEWKSIEFCPKYSVSSKGQIAIRGKFVIKTIAQYNCNGYRIVNLKVGGKYKTFRVHRLVAQAFIPNPNSLPQVNHKDENKANNCVENLEWCTALYNNTYGSRPNKIRASNSRRGCTESIKQKIKNTVTEKQGHKVARLDSQGNILKIYDSVSEAQRDTGIRRQTIRAICNDVENLTTHKSHWKYLD